MGTTTSPVRAEAPGGQFPMATTIDEALPLLRRPFSPRRCAQTQVEAEGDSHWGEPLRRLLRRGTFNPNKGDA